MTHNMSLLEFLDPNVLSKAAREENMILCPGHASPSGSGTLDVMWNLASKTPESQAAAFVPRPFWKHHLDSE